ncbi:hypothetical protein CHELA20_51642 [Hyphomicrobiales bacterium]|nr:hypothetical protein CHELA20_51642 [Hyphomicrobiales bacterium]
MKHTSPRPHQVSHAAPIPPLRGGGGAGARGSALPSDRDVLDVNRRISEFSSRTLQVEKLRAVAPTQ